MALTYSLMKDLAQTAPDFSLPGVDGKTYSLDSFKNSKGLLVVFMCNHCPYVIAVQRRLNELAKTFQPKGISVIGINPNDPVQYPEDSFEEMKKRSKEQGYVFPYVQDITQEVARSYNAVCTPDPFLYIRQGSQFKLYYHGRIDDNWKDESQVKSRDLHDAMIALLNGENPPMDQKPSMGCSIKWK
jgi:peroxiredoxin